MKLLVAEDEPKIVRFLTRGLEEEGYSVEAVADGDQAIERGLSGNHDIMILDLLLPKSSGFTVCRRLREQGSKLPILMLTAKDTLDDKLRGLNLGADDYLTKPFAFAELVARVRALARRSQDSVLKVADLTIDPSARSVTRDGRAIELTNREFQLLYYLARHAGTVQSRSTLLSEVWGFDFEGTTNVLEAYVRLLRRKVDAGHKARLIWTVRREGYVLKDPLASSGRAAASSEPQLH